MKKIIFSIALLIVSGATFSQAPNVTKDAQGNYHSISVLKDSSSIKTGNVYIDKDGAKYPVYSSLKGRLFINRISKKSGNPYKYYLVLNK